MDLIDINQLYMIIIISMALLFDSSKVFNNRHRLKMYPLGLYLICFMLYFGFQMFQPGGWEGKRLSLIYAIIHIIFTGCYYMENKRSRLELFLGTLVCISMSYLNSHNGWLELFVYIEISFTLLLLLMIIGDKVEKRKVIYSSIGTFLLLLFAILIENSKFALQISQEVVTIIIGLTLLGGVIFKVYLPNLAGANSKHCTFLIHSLIVMTTYIIISDTALQKLIIGNPFTMTGLIISVLIMSKNAFNNKNKYQIEDRLTNQFYIMMISLVTLAAYLEVEIILESIIMIIIVMAGMIVIERESCFKKYLIALFASAAPVSLFAPLIYGVLTRAYGYSLFLIWSVIIFNFIFFVREYYNLEERDFNSITTFEYCSALLIVGLVKYANILVVS